MEKLATPLLVLDTYSKTKRCGNQSSHRSLGHTAWLYRRVPFRDTRVWFLSLPTADLMSGHRVGRPEPETTKRNVLNCQGSFSRLLCCVNKSNKRSVSEVDFLSPQPQQNPVFFSLQSTEPREKNASKIQEESSEEFFLETAVNPLHASIAL